MSTNTPKPCFAISAEANFEDGTWTFNPIGKYSVGAGRYAILREAEFLDLIGQHDELLAALKSLRADHSIQSPHHEDMCDLCRAADAAIAQAESR